MGRVGRLQVCQVREAVTSEPRAPGQAVLLCGCSPRHQ